jgi:hypothetical protein
LSVLSHNPGIWPNSDLSHAKHVRRWYNFTSNDQFLFEKDSYMSTASIHAIPTLTGRISPDEARAAATDFLLDHVGNQLVTGQPHLMVSAVRTTWIVPVQLAYIHTGSIGDVGVVAVDEETGRVVAWTPIDQMKTAGRTLRLALEPELSEQFQTFIATSSQESEA